MSAHVLLNLLNELGKGDKMRGLPSILSLFRNSFNKFNNTRARMLDSIYHMTKEKNLLLKHINYSCFLESFQLDFNLVFIFHNQMMFQKRLNDSFYFASTMYLVIFIMH